jgi:ABC-2 type transport system permease protein
MIALYLKTWRDHWKSFLAWSITLVALTSLQMSIYPSISENSGAIQQFLDAYPDAIKKIFRMQDYTTGPGFLGTELYSLMIPLVLIAVGATWGASATAEEEDEGTADLLLTLPISRIRMLIAKTLAAVCALVLLALVAMANILLLKDAVGMEIETGDLIAGTISSITLGLFFTGIAFLAGSFSRQKGAAVGVVTGIALISFLIYSLSGLVDDFDPVMPFNPMQWGLGGNPLFNGIDYPGNLKLLTGTLILLGLANAKFKTKDISTP